MEFKISFINSKQESQKVSQYNYDFMAILQ